MLLNPLPSSNRRPLRFSRTFVTVTVATTLAAVGLALGAATRSDAGTGGEETRTLDELYAAAKAEGGRLVVYAGGDWKDQQDATKQAFEHQLAAGKKAIGLGGWVTPDAGKDPAAETIGMLPNSSDPFVAWGQREAILKNARHPAAAKLFLNWQLSKENQTSDLWSVRTDVAPPAGLKRVWQYDNADLDGFASFMQDRAAAERLRQQMTVYIGEVEGAPTPGRLGTHPGR
ncbi:hypothetical protein ACWD4O_42060 [Streptomyces sp. NPDC002623]